jgi:hypothetical protein
MPYPALVDVEKIRLTFMHCLKLPQVADMISLIRENTDQGKEPSGALVLREDTTRHGDRYVI